MADHTQDDELQTPPEINEVLESVLIQAIEKATTTLNDEGVFAPFTSVVVGTTLYDQDHGGETEECFASAEDTVKNTPDASAYAFCFDGFIKTDEGDKDCIIAEGGMAGEAQGSAFGRLYSYNEETETFTFDDDIYYLDEAPNYLAHAQAVELIGEETIEE